jgi:hypothetical protein
VHLAFKAGLPGWEVAAILPLPAGSTRLLRQLAFLGLMFTLLLALDRAIPYATWRWWHRLSGPIFLIVVAHWLSIRSPIALLSPVGVWLATLAGLGVAGAAWKLLLYPWLSSQAGYRIVEVTPGPGAVRLELLPTGRALNFAPGQFGFLGLQVEGLRAPHPFTLAGAPDADGRVVFMIRALGAHTRRLVDRAAVGMHAVVHGPFGRFKRRTHSAGELWIAGGVGISPFLAWLDDPHAIGLERVHLFYFYTPGAAFPSPRRSQSSPVNARWRCIAWTPARRTLRSSARSTPAFAALARSAWTSTSAARLACCRPVARHCTPAASARHESATSCSSSDDEPARDAAAAESEYWTLRERGSAH